MEINPNLDSNTYIHIFVLMFIMFLFLDELFLTFTPGFMSIHAQLNIYIYATTLPWKNLLNHHMFLFKIYLNIQ